ncbi:MAG TPA: hypothetical protein VNT25_04845 [Allosphingosinicella sp.]|nr:hypothetical protein [Allosphingosinicella sp.]
MLYLIGDIRVDAKRSEKVVRGWGRFIRISVDMRSEHQWRGRGWEEPDAFQQGIPAVSFPFLLPQQFCSEELNDSPELRRLLELSEQGVQFLEGSSRIFLAFEDRQEPRQ